MSNLYQATAPLILTEKHTGKLKVNVISLLGSFYNSLLNLGLKNVSSERGKKYIRITNFISINTLAGSLIYLSCSVIWQNWPWFILLVPFCIISVSVLCLNSLGKINLSRAVFLVGTNMFVFVNSLYIGPAAENKNFFIIAIIVPFLIYDIRKITFIICGVILPVFFSYMYQLLTPYFSAYNLPLEQQLLLGKASMAVQFMLALSAVYQFVYYSRKAEDAVEASHQQLSLQTKELKRSNADLEQFAYIISHDLKAPARNISSFMNLLSRYAADMKPEAREFVNFSLTGAKRMEQLIEDLLSYCRIDTNLPNPTPVNPDDVINTLRIELKDKLAAANGKILVNGGLPVLNNVHQTLIYHVFQNLITNGLKFNKSGKPEIEISCTESSDYYTFSIKDNGIGISKEYSKAIFQMFKRLHTENEYEGTGIGLAICKKVVEYYHGEIWFDSEIGKGTVFHFTIRKF